MSQYSRALAVLADNSCLVLSTIFPFLTSTSIGYMFSSYRQAHIHIHKNKEKKEVKLFSRISLKMS